MNKAVLLIDANTIGYTSLFQPSLSSLSYSDAQGKKLSGAIVGTINTVSSLRSKFPDALPLALWDGHAEWRTKLLDTYKSGRKADASSPDPAEREKAALQASYIQQSKIIKNMFSSLGIPQLDNKNLEADDLAGALSERLKTHQITLVTKDTDWLQCVSKNVSWYSPSPEKLITFESISKFGLEVERTNFDSPSQYLACKAMSGDKADAIQGVEGIGLTTAKKFYDEYGGFESLWQAYDNGVYKPKGKKAEALVSQASRDVYQRNMALMSFKHTPAEYLAQTQLTRDRPDQKDFIRLCEMIEAKQLLGSFEPLTANFENHNETWQAVCDNLKH